MTKKLMTAVAMIVGSCLIPLAAQKRINKIDEFYKANDSTSLANYLNMLYHLNFDSLDQKNDTLFMVYQIHKSIIIHNQYFRGSRADNLYFFLQRKYPDVYFNSDHVTMPNTLFYNKFLACDTIKPLQSNPFLSEEIRTFLGTDPTTTNKPYIKSYGKDKRLNRDKLHKRAVKEISEYHNKMEWIHRFFNLCYTWGHISSDYTYLNVKTIEFQNDLYTAKVYWSCCAYGGSYLYEYKKGAWSKTKTFVEWID